MLFKNRTEAGRALAAALEKFKGAKKTVVLGLPRGGVVVAKLVADHLGLPLDVVIPRKLGAPDNPELAIGAIAEDAVILDPGIISALNVSEEYIRQEIARQTLEAKRRLELYRKGKPRPDWKGWTALLVDDGIATGSTMRASIAALKKLKVANIVVAVPVGPTDTIEDLKKEADLVVCLYTPSSFMAVGQFYDRFPQTSDEEVMEILCKSKSP
jgi:putative phosphoribosyl transferase